MAINAGTHTPNSRNANHEALNTTIKVKVSKASGGTIRSTVIASRFQLRRVIDAASNFGASPSSTPR
ncbi:hypothetical protein D3C75_1058690 [compost metagenome]